jgi:hypothetical protein
MREMYFDYASWRILYSEIGFCERNKRKLQHVYCRLYPFICWIIIKEGPGKFSCRCIPHWVNQIYLCIYCIVYLLCFISSFVFILLLRDPIFLTIKPFKDEVLCDVSPLEVFNVLLGQTYLWKHHVVYESMPHSVIITLNKKLYRIPEAIPPSVISLISTKQCGKVISHTRKFFFFVIRFHNGRKIAATSRVSVDDLSTQQRQVDKVVESYSDILSSPTGVPLHYQV